jgi:uncharacterized protein YgiM (DUF1202 family)
MLRKSTWLKLVVFMLVVALVAVSVPDPTAAAPAPETHTLDQQAGWKATIKVAKLNVRRAPRTSSTILGELTLNQVVPIVGRDRLASWLQVATPFGTGWIASRFVTTNIDVLRLPLTYIPPHIIVIANPYAHLRSGPFYSYPVIGRLAYKTDLDIIGLHSRGLMVQVVLENGTVGWVASDLVKIAGDLTDVPYTDRLVLPLGQIMSYRVRVRAQPSPKGDVLATVGLGEKYTILAVTQSELYYLISGPFGTGWVFADYVRVLGYRSVIPVVK